MVVTLPTIQLGKAEKPSLLSAIYKAVKSKLQETKIIAGLKPVKVPVSIKLAAGAAATSAVLAPAASARAAAGAGKILLKAAKSVIPKSMAGKLGAVTIISAATTSPTIKEILTKKLHPVKAGKALGSFVEEKVVPYAKGEKEMTTGQLVKAGLASGGVAAAGVAGVAALAKAISSLRSPKIEIPNIPSQVVVQSPSGVSSQALPPEILPQFQQATTATPEQQKAVPAAQPSIKISNRPIIDIRISTYGIRKTFKRKEIYI